MKKEQRLTQESQYTRLFSHGKSWANELLIMKALPNELERSRFGFSVSKRTGKSVIRNRVKRLLRECARLTPCKLGWDIVFVARSATSEANYHQLKRAVEELTQRAKLLQEAWKQ